MSFIKDLLKEKALWWTFAAFLTIYLGTLFFSRYYLQPSRDKLGELTTWPTTERTDVSPTDFAPDTTTGMAEPPAFALQQGVDYYAKIYTDYGVITIDLFENYAPNIVNNFVYLGKNGFYNGLYFHRVIPKYLIQTGDPTGTGRGGVNYYVPGDFDPRLPKYGPGIVGMANDGNKDHNGSQFFIVASGADPQVIANWHKVYPVFGKVVSGMTIVDKIANVQVDANYRPLKKITITKLEILENK